MRKRLLRLLFLFIGITMISFIVIHLAPGNPGESAVGMNPGVSADAAMKLNRLYGLDKPLWRQYRDWAMNVACLNLGQSLVDGQSVRDKIAAVIPVTFTLNALSLIISLVLGIPLGVWLALGYGTAGEKMVSGAAFFLISIPSFWISLVFMSFFGVGLSWFPVSGLRSFYYDELSGWQRIWDVAWHLFLPVCVMSLSGVAALSRYVQSSMREVLNKEYIMAARARGISENKIIYEHALKNALLPVVTMLGLSVPGLLGGSVVLESVFSIPGMGRLFYTAVLSRDYPVIMGILVLGAFLTLLGNLLADIIYSKVDPRAKTGDAA